MKRLDKCTQVLNNNVFYIYLFGLNDTMIYFYIKCALLLPLKNGFHYLLFYLNIKNETNEKWFQDQKGIRSNLSAIRFSAPNLMKLTFFKDLEQKVWKTQGASLTCSQY